MAASRARHDFRRADQRAGDTHGPACTTGCPATPACAAPDLSDEAVRDSGNDGRASRPGRCAGFLAPVPQRVMLWDVQHALLLRPMLGAVPDPDLAGWCRARARSLRAGGHAGLARPARPGHPHRPVRLERAGRRRRPITGIIDFGDASWSALVVDLAAVLETVDDGREERRRRVLPRRPPGARWLREGHAARAGRAAHPWRAARRADVRRRRRARVAGGVVRRRRMRSWLTCAARPRRSCACSSGRLGRGRRRLGGREPGSGWSQCLRWWSAECACSGRR